ncbi:hypothetical protein CRP01_31310 [Flavilitoribacter nigricans DSM 23189 = NBRC 102662]|uniref:DUF4369 domain-containing protein n=1 Tax=Flavilitoribacter nigricans (strain ATCC 23147 / DSM 23189 / NBRC 102662 / NCIMB 1420 / SS-2) TaxID=1122177 RepID=A0A2D0N4I0_FLAN2|nr:hypothetical protein CRP01_31310 [Flavilitoribacter nigricans DSM 23189 = NBRC 102662]
MLCLPLSLAAVTIEGQVRNFTFPEVMFNLLFGRFHLFMDDEIILPDAAGNFRYELEVDEIRFAQLKFKDKTIQLFLDPAAERLIVELDYAADDLALRFSGDSAAENTFINQRLYPNYHDKLRTLLPEQSSNPDAVDHFATEEETVEVDQLNEIRDQISEANYELLRREISAYYLTIRLQAGNNIGWRNHEEYEAHWMMRSEELGKLIDCQSANKFAPYFNHLIHTYYDHLRIKYYYLRSPADSTLWQQRFGVNSEAALADLKRNDKYNVDLYAIGKAGFCEAIFEKLLSNRIFRSQRDGDYENLIRIYEAFEEQFPESKYLPVLKAGMERI